MPKDCEGCNWSRTVWCSVKDRLVSKGLVPPCISEDTDVTIRKLREELAEAEEALEMRWSMCHSWEGRWHIAEREIAKAKAEITTLRTEVARRTVMFDDSQRMVIRQCTQYQECQTEIERLRKKCNLEMAARMMEEALSPGLETRFEKLKADAEIGQLVRGMPDRTSLRRFAEGTFGAARADPNYRLTPSCWGAVPLLASDDPTKALQALQEVVDVGT